ncbi:CusB/HlyD membrane fusion family barrel-sandwich protein [Trinickia symbiotica]|uniref:Secretion protein HylD n=1 Tax=Trinickia symbiotica TaxID=863227 RepID=A0A2N7WRZ8_9BURK|nr:HlyD family efflux transporter periplasmic adaptor subunit [Trinickia symbiotica]PMS32177.1 secretion protein HylD [Trinickia symbiotica]PPK41984.1 CusB/HlyD membrane fusion family barrel-sandwich protein [Trinickia symbiotica]
MNAPLHVEASALALLWQLSARAREASSEETLGFVIVNETLSLVPYRQAAWWRAPAPVPGAVAAVSGLPRSDPGAPYVQWLSEVCRVLEGRFVQAGAATSSAPAQRGDIAGTATTANTAAARAVPTEPLDPAAHTRPYAFTADSLPEPLAADWAAWWPTHALWVPLADRTGRSLGGVIFAREAQWTHVEEALLGELARVWSHALAAFSPRASWIERGKLALRAGKHRRRVIAAIAVALVVPVPLTVLAPAEVTPKDPFVVRAPLDGVIDRLFAQPNQRVEAGTPLFALDSTTLASRYALADKNYATAQEEYRQTAQLAVTDDKDRLDMALRKGKLEQSAVELDYTARELARVRVNAPRAGVAVFSDPNDWNGKAVSIGEKVMLLADPAHVELTAYVPVADNVDVVPGATVTLYPKSSPLAAYDARIDTVAYRAEPTPDGVVAYRVKATFVGSVKPSLGVMGTARIHGHWVPLAYYLLRRPLATARQWLGW